METNLTPYTAVTSIPARSVLVFAPHPDDEAIGCGGLLATYAQEEIPVDVIYLTSGEFGDHGKAGAATREAESQAAGKSLSVRQAHWWREPDRGVKYHEELIEKTVAAILTSGADLLLCPGINEIHPDHRSTAWLVIEAARRVNAQGQTVRVALYEVGAPLHYVNTLVDISAVVEAKRSAIRCYASQLALSPYDELILGLNQFRSYTLGSSIHYVEAYRLLEADELRQPDLLAEPELQRQERLNLVSIRQDCPKVTVLIRSMGRASLARTLNSVALQTWPNVEVLLLNARGNGHPKAAKTAGGFPVRFIDSDTGFSRPAAANQLLQQADSEFALFLDDDDWITPEHISSLMDALRKSPAAIAARSDVEMGLSNGNSWQTEHIFTGHFDRYRLLFENYLPIHSVLFRLPDARDKYNCRFDQELEVFEDWDFWLQLTRHADMVSTGHLSAYYCKNEADGSDVFAPSASNQEQLRKLRAKWFGALDAEDFDQLLSYVQQQYRNRNAAEVQLEAAIAHSKELATELDGLRQITAARDNEIVNFKQHVTRLESMQEAKDTDLIKQAALLREQEVHLAEKDTLLAEQDSLLRKKEVDLAEKNSLLAEQESHLADKDAQLAKEEAHIAELASELNHTRAELAALQFSSRRRLWLLRKLIKPTN
ncbi:MAG: PIG-L family deacetylase [Pseudomonadales bacterium]|nr:PIG-L family deacetylase [Pseudomonadales bacterium]